MRTLPEIINSANLKLALSGISSLRVAEPYNDSLGSLDYHRSNDSSWIRVYMDERGRQHKEKVAQKDQELEEYLINEAITNYAIGKYREKGFLKKFEDPSRSRDRIIEEIYKKVLPDVHPEILGEYDDLPYAIADVLSAYVLICETIRTDFSAAYQNVKEEIDYIADGKFLPVEIDNVYEKWSQVKRLVSVICTEIPCMKQVFGLYDQYIISACQRQGRQDVLSTPI